MRDGWKASVKTVRSEASFSLFLPSEVGPGRLVDATVRRMPVRRMAFRRMPFRRLPLDLIRYPPSRGF